MRLLDGIQSPKDLRRLAPEQLPGLAAEIRERIIEVVAVNGGHLASSLGAVELAIALHYCLNTPQDQIVWDVGHQAYAHKILTGRNRDFASLRQYQGISGFPSREESVYDAFTCGHSSTAISAALGLACSVSAGPSGQRPRVVAVIGDGSISGGLCFEGLNNAGHLKKDILVILNTNELSIAPNAGALSTYLNKIISLPIYNRFRKSLEDLIQARLPKGSRLIKIANKFEESLKALFIPGMLFEELGFRYFGPLDGHNLTVLVPTLKNILSIKGPLLLHVVTKKGKGYGPAEKDPVRFHGTGPFDPATGERPAAHKEDQQVGSFTEVFSRRLVELAKSDERIVAITAAMPEGTGLDRFRDAYPARFFDVGIAEAHAVCFAGGLSRAGYKPVVALYSTFLQRAYDQIIEDIALQKAGVVFAVDRAGIVGEDGVTHQGIFDIAFLRHIPNLVVAAPRDGIELESMLELAVQLNLPCAIRYPKAPPLSLDAPREKLEIGRAELLREGEDFLLIALGSMVTPSLQAAALLEKEGLRGTVVNARFAKPLDASLLARLGNAARKVFTVEEGVIEGGFGSAVAEILEHPVTRLGLPCAFIPHGKRDLLLERYGLTARGIAGKIREGHG